MGVVHRRDQNHINWHWGDIDVFSYNSNQATKQVIIGPNDGANNFEVRVFTIPPRGFSSLDEHQHDHGVMILSGQSRVMLGERYEEVAAGDVVYIPGMERHQFENLSDEPLVFLCIIPPKPKVAAKPSTPMEQAEPVSG
jgi:quercetin dioxygenase-like cupin family protein